MKRLWKRAAFLLPGLLLAAAVSAFAFVPLLADRRYNKVVRGTELPVSPQARQLHHSLFIADLHADFLLWNRNLLERSRHGHLDLPRLREGNVGLQVFSSVTKSPRGHNYGSNASDSDSLSLLVFLQRWPRPAWKSLTARAIFQARRLHAAAAQSGGALVVIHTAPELETYLLQKKSNPQLLAALLSVEGLHALDGQADHLDTLYDAGYRMMGLTHFFDNEVAGSAHGVKQGGLTDMGRHIVRRMEERGILIDLAHASAKTIDDVLAMATRPVVVSHTGVQATCPGPRNLTDDQLRRIARTGGVIGLGYWPEAVGSLGAPAIARAIRHTANVVGVNHVALGSDFDGATTMPFDTTGLDQITQALLNEGFSDADIARIMGGNVLELLRRSLPKQ